MSVLIRGMEMPKDCLFCVAHRPDSVVSNAHCAINGREFASVLINGKQVFEEWIDGRPEWCSLIELPPHGRLVDAVALKDSLIVEYPSVTYAINNAPTIIEAEEVNEDA